LISRTARIAKNVHLGKGSTVEDFVVLGKSSVPNGQKAKPLRIGLGSHLRCGTVIYAGTTIGNQFVTGDYAKIRENNRIGDNVSIGSNTIVERDSVIGNDVSIHSDCFIPEYTTIGDSVWIGPCVVITNVLHPPCPYFKKEDLKERPRCLTGPTFKRGAVIGAAAIILPGTTIGENSLVGAGSLVIHDVPRDSVVVGSPAKVIGKTKGLICLPGFYARGEVYSWRR
jgi:acetyltransferase-like isoleucine patch superfamily enzyme